MDHPAETAALPDHHSDLIRQAALLPWTKLSARTTSRRTNRELPRTGLATEARLPPVSVPLFPLAYYAYFDDPATPWMSPLRAFDALVKAGTVLHIGASNYTPERLAAALGLQRELGFTEFTVLPPLYNLVERGFGRCCPSGRLGPRGAALQRVRAQILVATAAVGAGPVGVLQPRRPHPSLQPSRTGTVICRSDGEVIAYNAGASLP